MIATKSLSNNPAGAESNPGASEMQHSHIVLHFFLPADQQTPEPVQPAVGSFHYPATRPVSGDSPFVYPFFSPTPNVACIAPCCYQLPHLWVVVSFVQTHILGLVRSWLRPLDHGSFQSALYQLHIVPVRFIHGYPDGNPMALCQQAPFGTPFASVSGIRSCSFSPPRVPWSWPHPSLATPSLGRGGHHIQSTPPAIAAQIHHRPATAETADGRCWRRRSPWAGPSTGTRCASHRRFRPYTGALGYIGDLPWDEAVPAAAGAKYAPTKNREYAMRRLRDSSTLVRTSHSSPHFGRKYN